MRHVFKWTKENPGKTSGRLGFCGDLFMLGTGMITGNPLLIAAGILFCIADAVLGVFADRKQQSDTEFYDPQDDNPGLRRFFDPVRYPHEFAMLQIKFGMAALLAAGLQVTGGAITGLPYLNYVEETRHTFFEVTAGERIIGIDGIGLSGLIFILASLIGAYVPEKSPEQISRRRKERLARPARTALHRILRDISGRIADTVQQRVPFICSIGYQIALIPYAVAGFLGTTISAAVTQSLSAVFYALTNYFYGCSSKRVLAAPVAMTETVIPENAGNAPADDNQAF